MNEGSRAAGKLKDEHECPLVFWGCFLRELGFGVMGHVRIACVGRLSSARTSLVSM